MAFLIPLVAKLALVAKAALAAARVAKVVATVARTARTAVRLARAVRTVHRIHKVAKTVKTIAKAKKTVSSMSKMTRRKIEAAAEIGEAALNESKKIVKESAKSGNKTLKKMGRGTVSVAKFNKNYVQPAMVESGKRAVIKEIQKAAALGNTGKKIKSRAKSKIKSEAKSKVRNKIRKRRDKKKLRKQRNQKVSAWTEKKISRFMRKREKKNGFASPRPTFVGRRGLSRPLQPVTAAPRSMGGFGPHPMAGTITNI